MCFRQVLVWFVLDLIPDSTLYFHFLEKLHSLRGESGSRPHKLKKVNFLFFRELLEDLPEVSYVRVLSSDVLVILCVVSQPVNVDVAGPTYDALDILPAEQYEG